MPKAPLKPETPITSWNKLPFPRCEIRENCSSNPTSSTALQPALIKAEQDRAPDFLRLGNALSVLYPQGCNEKRLLDAMLLAMPK